MKILVKTILFIVVSGMLIIAAIKTDGFTFNDTVTNRAAACLQATAIIISVILFTWIFSGKSKRMAANETLSPFKEMSD